VDFSKDFFGKETNLTVSGQLEAESYCLAFKNVYTFGPTFRAENSNTPRHAAEFWMIEPEIAFAGLQENMNLAEDMLKYTIGYVLKHCPEEMRFFNNFVDKSLLGRLENLVESKFGRRRMGSGHRRRHRDPDLCHHRPLHRGLGKEDFRPLRGP
jgi:asparaginyl-tRNA synthetase